MKLPLWSGAFIERGRISGKHPVCHPTFLSVCPPTFLSPTFCHTHSDPFEVPTYCFVDFVVVGSKPTDFRQQPFSRSNLSNAGALGLAGFARPGSCGTVARPFTHHISAVTSAGRFSPTRSSRDRLLKILERVRDTALSSWATWSCPNACCVSRNRRRFLPSSRLLSWALLGGPFPGLAKPARPGAPGIHPYSFRGSKRIRLCAGVLALAAQMQAD